MSTEQVQLAAPMAEFEALRAEILSIRQVKRNLLSVALAAYAAIFSFALGKDGDSLLLLVVPPLGLVLCLFELSETIQIARLGTYIREQVWPEIQRLTGYEHSWEDRPDGQGPVGRGGLAMLLDGGFPLMLFGASVAAILTTTELSETAGAVAWTCAAFTLLAPAWYGVFFFVNYRRKRRAMRSSSSSSRHPN